MERTEAYEQDWYMQRIDRDDGEIRYEAHGPKESFVRFEGPNAKHDCDRFMNAVKPPAQQPDCVSQFKTWYREKNGEEYDYHYARHEDRFQWYARGACQGFEAGYSASLPREPAQGAEVERHLKGLAYAKEGYEAHKHEGHEMALQEAICHYNATTQPCLLNPPQSDNEAVERVARALAAEDYRQKQRGDYNDADTYASRHWGEYQPEARVAIAALRPAAKEE